VVDERSIVEALDDLGPPNGFSPAGYARLCALRDELRGLRGRSAQPLPDLVADVERTLGLDVEVAARHADDQALARAHLDAFAAVAAEFAETAESVSLGAFVAYLRAAEDRERGLTPGHVAVQAGAVQVLTAHAAKGLEWDVVAVPGLTRRVFPAEGGPSDTWIAALGALPSALRGDEQDLPAFDLGGATDQAEVEVVRKRFVEECEERGLAEERRLAYVAVTRARHLVLCSGYWWDEATKPRGPSVFLDEVRGHCDEPDVWAAPPDEGTNPLTAQARRAVWPLDPLGERRPALSAAAALVGEAARTPATDEERQAGAEWAEEAELLLAERARTRRRELYDVELPSHLSVSQLVALRRDPGELARSIRRPVPFAPAPLARRGTAFHAWLERRFGAQRLLDLDELPGSADAGAAPDSDFEALQRAFLASEWADRVPAQVEVPFATVVAGVVVRGRMDAVFADQPTGAGASRWDVVDWKTGAPPEGDGAEAAAVQLAAYRLAWADLASVPVEQVRAAFHYVRSNLTVRPVDLLDADGLAALLTNVPVVNDPSH
jgi:DNA helicase-2/ATP-dependent DNA helicase PcrA